MEMESCEATCPRCVYANRIDGFSMAEAFVCRYCGRRRELVRLASLKPVRRPRRKPVLPQGLTPLRALITPYTQVGIESRQDGVRHLALHIRRLCAEWAWN